MSSPAKFFLAAVLPLVAALGVARAQIKVGDAFPAPAAHGVVNLAGGELPATQGRLMLVDFWASWCAPCKASFPMMAKLQKDYAERGFTVLAIGIDEKPALAAAFWKKMAPPFPTLHDRAQALVQKVAPPTMPTSYLVDGAGKVRFVHSGFHGDATERELRKQIDLLLTEKK